MEYIIAVVVICFFSLIYVVGYMLNSKSKIEGDTSLCKSCSIFDCFNCHKKEDK